MNNCAVILAAGEGKRMRSAKPKVLQEVLFKPMIHWVVDAAAAVCGGNICVVTGSGREAVERALENRFAQRQVRFALQAQRLGTAHAVMCAKEFLRENAGGHVAVLAGDAPLIGVDTLADALAFHRENNCSATVITAELENPTGYGRIIRDKGGNLAAIVEEKEADAAQRAVREINSGAYWFRTDDLLAALEQVSDNNASGEYYLTDVIAIFRKENRPVGAYRTADPREILGANDKYQLHLLNAAARDMIIRRLMEAGVTFPDTAGITIGPDVTVGPDTQILAGSILRGKTVIGADCVIGPGSVIQDSTVGDGTVVNASQIEESTLGACCKIGPFAHLRPGTRLADGVKAGNFVELKNCKAGEKASFAHLSYMGDCIVGDHTNIGCGTITVNYDGRNKYTTHIGSRAFVGCNSNLIAPVAVSDDAYVAAGSTVTGDVPPFALAVARARQVNIDEWVSRWREKSPSNKNGQ